MKTSGGHERTEKIAYTQFAYAITPRQSLLSADRVALKEIYFMAVPNIGITNRA